MPQVPREQLTFLQSSEQPCLDQALVSLPSQSKYGVRAIDMYRSLEALLPLTCRGFASSALPEVAPEAKPAPKPKAATPAAAPGEPSC